MLCRQRYLCLPTHEYGGCSVPEGHGASSTPHEEDAFWKDVFMTQPTRRRESEPSSKRRKNRIESSLPATG
ncbi:hypothetical protein PSEEN3684 [Pseudomonas entomophila L48]|uniref:Uncharacterized protein n=1 Tax=Pseudomonas entomophila (strain L48) TaxID=384676 RepID=Q1I7H4_PSEE4|nr:hypothetical protein PSEEN3684 [Pseudomonas entomophila L48]